MPPSVARSTAGGKVWKARTREAEAQTCEDLVAPHPGPVSLRPAPGRAWEEWGPRPARTAPHGTLRGCGRCRASCTLGAERTPLPSFQKGHPGRKPGVRTPPSEEDEEGAPEEGSRPAGAAAFKAAPASRPVRAPASCAPFVLHGPASEVCGPLPLDCHFLRGEIKRPGRGPHPFLTKPTSQHLLWRPTPTPQKGHQDTQTVPRHARGVGQLKAPAGWVSGCPRQTDERGGCASPHFRPALSSCLLQPAEAGPSGGALLSPKLLILHCANNRYNSTCTARRMATGAHTWWPGHLCPS